MAQPELLGRKLFLVLACHRNGRRLSRSDDLEISDVHLYLTRREVRVPGGLGPELHRPTGQNYRLGTKPGSAFHHLRRCPVGIAGELHQAFAVAQIDEDESAQVPAAVYPAAEPYLLAQLGPA